jgi:ferredoxin
MPRLTIDNMPIEVPAGSTILQAARALGLDIPSLCHHDGYRPATSCMLCLVRVKEGVNAATHAEDRVSLLTQDDGNKLPRSSGRLVPSCATAVQDGMEIESQTAEIQSLRRAGLELLLSDHAGDCVGPCEMACPLGVDVPTLLRQVAAGQWREAIATIRREMALPSVLGRVCERHCEKACRRRQVDSAAAICAIKRYVADGDLASSEPYLPPREPASGKRVAIIGAGPAGLSAAWHLLMAGHGCTIFDEQSVAGGRLRDLTANAVGATGESALSPSVLDSEVALVAQLGAVFQLGTRVDSEPSLADLQREYQAVLLATGQVADRQNVMLGAAVQNGRVIIDPATQQTAIPGLFAAGDAVRPGSAIVRTVADGKSAAACIDAFLRTGTARPASRPFASRLGRLQENDLVQLTVGASRGGRMQTDRHDEPSEDVIRTEAQRCLHCDCAAKDGCRLRHYAQQYGVAGGRYRGRRRPLVRSLQHGDVVYEPGKCILCGLCIQAAEAAREPLGLTFVGRGFDVRVGVPFNRSLAEGLQRAAYECANVCPSGAIVRRDQTRE